MSTIQAIVASFDEPSSGDRYGIRKKMATEKRLAFPLFVENVSKRTG